MSGGLLGELIADTSFSALPRDPVVLQLCMARRAMGCEFSVHLPASCPNAFEAGEAALDEIQETERVLTVYGEDSDVAFLNRYAADRAVRVDARLFALLQRSAELHRLTDGAFDVAVHALVKVWGFFGGSPHVPDEQAIRDALAHSGMRHVVLDPAERTVRYRVRGLEINFGSIGKGYGIDRAATQLRETFGVTCALIQGGLSSIYGMGSPADDGQGWLVGVQNPLDRRRRVATVRLRNRALGTAGIDQQSFAVGGRRYGHILDPRTGWPASGPASVSVVADDAATADALATALFVMGLDKTRDFCQNHPDIGALVVLPPGRRLAEGAAALDGRERRSATEPQVVAFNLSSREADLRPADGSSCTGVPERAPF